MEQQQPTTAGTATVAPTATTGTTSTQAPKPISAPLTIADFIDDDDVTEIPTIQVLQIMLKTSLSSQF